jgi:hypothetical protein
MAWFLAAVAAGWYIAGTARHGQAAFLAPTHPVQGLPRMEDRRIGMALRSRIASEALPGF